VRTPRGYTLVELLASLTLAAVVLLLAGRLLLSAMDAWRREADRASTAEAAVRLLDALALDFERQPRHPAWPLPLSSLDLDPADEVTGFFVVSERAEVRALAWIRLADGDVWRLEADPAATLEALPANAAVEALAAALADEESPSAALRESGAVRIARRVAGLHTARAPRDGMEAAQLQATLLSAWAVASLPAGTRIDDDLARRLPSREVHHRAIVWN